jgi:hypothetical protein
MRADAADAEIVRARIEVVRTEHAVGDALTGIGGADVRRAGSQDEGDREADVQPSHGCRYTRCVRVGHLVVVGVVGVVLLLLCGLPTCTAAELAGELEVYDVRPSETTIALGVGERRQFSVWVRGESITYQWMLDGGPVSGRHSWTFTPTATQLGLHLVTLVAEGPEGRLSRSWTVQITLSRAAGATTTEASATSEPSPTTAPPTVAPLPSPSTSAPASTTAPTTTSSSTSSSSTSTRERPTTTMRPTTTSTVRATTTRPTTTSTARPTTIERPTTTATEPPTTTTTLRLVPPPAARSGGITPDEVRALLQRYAAAWRAHDVDELEAVGQVATPGQAAALKAYFESVRDLDVDVTILDIKTTGEEAVVRFIRRDRFRDPAGNLVSKDSPAIEKRVVRTPGGLRLAPQR